MTVILKLAGVLIVLEVLIANVSLGMVTLFLMTLRNRVVFAVLVLKIIAMDVERVPLNLEM